MSISLIVAYNKDNVIGVDGKLPWHLPEDQRWFKSITQDSVVVMGRRTWHTIRQPLTNRYNVVISNSLSTIVPGVIILNTIPEAIEFAELVNKPLFFIGGTQIYEEVVHLVDTMYITHVDDDEWDASYHMDEWNYGKLRAGCTFFPKIDMDEWSAVSCATYATHKSVVYQRIKHQ